MCHDLLCNILNTVRIRLIHRNIASNLMKLCSLRHDTNENVKYRRKSPERTTSISVTLKIFHCVWCLGKNVSFENIHENIF